MPVYWYDGLSVNIEIMDSQHKQLLKMINDLEAAIEQKRGVRELTEISGRMIAYAKEHFTLEEALMAEHEYPEQAEHVGQHEAFAEKVMSVEFIPDDPANTPEAILNYLRQWLIDHIHGTDHKLGAYLNGCGVK